MNHLEKGISDEELMLFKEGDQHVFRKIFDTYSHVIYKYIFSYCKNSEEAEDLVQEAFVTLFINRQKIEDAVGIYPYLFMVIKRMTITLFRKKVVQLKYINQLGQNWTEESSETEKEIEALELSTLIQGIIKNLPSRQQEVYRLNRFENLSYQEIADKIGVSKNTVKNHLIAASKTVKWKLEKKYLISLVILFFWMY